MLATTYVHTLTMPAKSDYTHLLSGIKSSKPTNKSQKLDSKRFLLVWNMRRCMDCPCVHTICRKQSTIHVSILFRTNWSYSRKHGTLCKQKWNRRTMVPKPGHVCTLLCELGHQAYCNCHALPPAGPPQWQGDPSKSNNMYGSYHKLWSIHSPLVRMYVLDTSYNCGTQLTRGMTVP